MLPCQSPVVMFPPVSGHGRYLASPVGAAKGSAPVERPCGGCISCRVNRQREWSLRMVLESAVHEFGYFATLTYAPEHLPTGATLLPSDLSGFLKRLRAALEHRFPGARLRFSACGEYGTEGRRPHYHAMLFLGSTMLPDLIHWRRSDSGQPLYRSQLVEDAWGKGFVELGSITPASCDYVAKYQVKRITGDRAAEYLRRMDSETGETWQVLPEFTRHSTRPGIGAPFFLKWASDVVGNDGRSGVVRRGGSHHAMPAYFLRMLKNNSARVLRGDDPLPGLEGLEGLEDVIAATRTGAAMERTRDELQALGGDRLLLAAMHKSDRDRVAEFRAHMLSQKADTL